MNKVVISAINFFEGGPLSVLKDCLTFLNNSKEFENFEFIALVHKVDLFNFEEYSKIKFIEFPKSRTSYLYRLNYEYFYFKKFVRQNHISFWFSLHDITPNVGNIPQVVYCHNPSAFNSVNFSDLKIQPIQFFFSLFYKYLYKFNIKKNQFVIVQQLWMKNKFIEMFDLDQNKIIVAPPEIAAIPQEFLNYQSQEEKKIKTFFFPTFPRPFKNIELICRAAKLVQIQNPNFKIIITIDGSENNYSSSVYKKYSSIENIEFIGLIERSEVYEIYSKSDCLIFPSKLETWGLPISEFKQFGKAIFASDLPYAKEAVGEYNKVSFFDPSDPSELAQLMLNFLHEDINYHKNAAIKYDALYVQGWNDLFNLLLK
jgi:glycosyltransferase involved in cell wall biosynthesis